MSKTKVLFLCTHNSARSQIAEGLLRFLYGDEYEVFSAGTNPTQVNPLAIKVMEEIGVDISEQYSKSLDVFKDEDIDLVVSVCHSGSKITCAICSSPIVNGKPELINLRLPRAKNYEQHAFDDPSEVEGSEEERLEAFRHTRDEIKKCGHSAINRAQLLSSDKWQQFSPKNQPNKRTACLKKSTISKKMRYAFIANKQ